jgi:hypothetical protein
MRSAALRGSILSEVLMIVRAFTSMTSSDPAPPRATLEGVPPAGNRPTVTRYVYKGTGNFVSERNGKPVDSPRKWSRAVIDALADPAYVPMPAAVSPAPDGPSPFTCNAPRYV